MNAPKAQYGEQNEKVVGSTGYFVHLKAVNEASTQPQKAMDLNPSPEACTPSDRTFEIAQPTEPSCSPESNRSSRSKAGCQHTNCQQPTRDSHTLPTRTSSDMDSTQTPITYETSPARQSTMMSLHVACYSPMPAVEPYRTLERVATDRSLKPIIPGVSSYSEPFSSSRRRSFLPANQGTAHHNSVVVSTLPISAFPKQRHEDAPRRCLIPLHT